MYHGGMVIYPGKVWMREFLRYVEPARYRLYRDLEVELKARGFIFEW